MQVSCINNDCKLYKTTVTCSAIQGWVSQSIILSRYACRKRTIPQMTKTRMTDQSTILYRKRGDESYYDPMFVQRAANHRTFESEGGRRAMSESVHISTKISSPNLRIERTGLSIRWRRVVDHLDNLYAFLFWLDEMPGVLFVRIDDTSNSRFPNWRLMRTTCHAAFPVGCRGFSLSTFVTSKRRKTDRRRTSWRLGGCRRLYSVRL